MFSIPSQLMFNVITNSSLQSPLSWPVEPFKPKVFPFDLTHSPEEEARLQASPDMPAFEGEERVEEMWDNLGDSVPVDVS